MRSASTRQWWRKLKFLAGCYRRLIHTPPSSIPRSVGFNWSYRFSQSCFIYWSFSNPCHERAEKSNETNWIGRSQCVRRSKGVTRVGYGSKEHGLGLARFGHVHQRHYSAHHPLRGGILLGIAQVPCRSSASVKSEPAWYQGERDFLLLFCLPALRHPKHPQAG